jgi:hypothetical protein
MVAALCLGVLMWTNDLRGDKVLVRLGIPFYTVHGRGYGFAATPFSVPCLFLPNSTIPGPCDDR